MPEFPSPSETLQELVIYKAYAAAQKALQEESKKVKTFLCEFNGT